MKGFNMNKFAPKGRVKQVSGTILAPENAGLRFVLNLCGQDGKYEAPLDKLLSSRWAQVKTNYKEWYATQKDFKLGMVNSNTCAVASDTVIVSALVKDKNNVVNSVALETAMKKVGAMANYERASVHISTMLVESAPQLTELATKYLIEQGINCYFYTEPQKG
jgi:hypothetical protein